MSGGNWVKELPAEIMICDPSGSILEMNAHAEGLFRTDGGRDLLGRNLLDCHPEPSLTKLMDILASHSTNCYFNTEDGEKRFFFQSPWYMEGSYSGFVEISFPVQDNIPHFIRE